MLVFKISTTIIATMHTSLKQLISTHPIIFLSLENCIYCDKLQRDLEAFGLQNIDCVSQASPNTYKKLMVTPQIKEQLIALLGITGENPRVTVPQLFIGGKHIGGYDNFTRLCVSGKIHQLVQPFGIALQDDF